MCSALAAGLTLKLIVSFETSILDNYNDEMVIHYDKEGKKLS